MDVQARLPKRVEMLVIGDEVLDGRIVDSNSQRLAWALAPLGLLVTRRTVVTDDIADIVDAAKGAADRGTELCIVSGGLGPTSDDLTAEAFADLLQVDLVRDPVQVAAIEAYLQRRGRTATENQKKQADRPRGATVLPNLNGTAPGFAVNYRGCRFVSLPGVPSEFDALIASAVVEPLSAVGQPRCSASLYCYGIIEAEADRRLRPLLERHPNVRLQYRIKFPEVHVSMHAPASEQEELAQAVAFAKEALGEAVYSTERESFAAAVLGLLAEGGQTVAVAESCTGGLVCDMLTDVPGSSANLHVGLTAYANAAKRGLLGVDEHVLHSQGAVSEQAVLEMAAGARALCNSDYGIAISGIAGPAGGTAHKPVGTVWFGLASPSGTIASHIVLPYDRRRNKVVAAYMGLNLLRSHLLAKSSNSLMKSLAG